MIKRLVLKRGFWISVLILFAVGAAVVTVRFVFLEQTKTAMLNGELPEEGKFGRIFSPKVGSLYFANVIDSDTLKIFLSKTSDAEAKSYVICLLGWTKRKDMVTELEIISASNDPHHSQRAVLSIVAIEEDISFPSKDFVEEFYLNYANEAVVLAKKEGISLREAAIKTAEKNYE